MSWTYASNPGLIPSILTALALLAVSAYAWRRRSVPGALAFAIGCLLAVPWVEGSILEHAAVETAARIFWLKFQVAWQVPTVTAITCFSLEYAWPGRWLTRRNLVLLSIHPLLAAILILTNNLHHLIWRSLAYDAAIQVQYNWGVWYILIYAYILILVELFFFIWLGVRSPQHRWPVAIMVVGQIVAGAGYTVELLHIYDTVVPLDVLFIGFLLLSFAIALFGFRILDPIALARGRVIEQLQAGMLVLDPQGRIASLNPAAERILGISSVHARGRAAGELLFTQSGGQRLEPGESEIVLGEGGGKKKRHYTVTVSLLKDWRGLEAGRLVMLHDVTEQKQAQAQILEQQRALATLGERERMARELHDSLGQVLGYAGLQVEAAAKLFEDGKNDIALPQLARLGRVIHEAHADVREYILNLRSTPSLEQPFFTTVRHYLEGFTNNYNIHTHLETGAGLSAEPFAADVQLQVFRILQEALSNARKHAHAHRVEVAFAGVDGRVRMTVEDDGRGFDPLQVSGHDPLHVVGEGGKHFGLRFMQERAEQIGGSLRVQSAPGAGTRVELDIPR